MNWRRRQRKLTYIIFAQTCNLSWAQTFLLESSPIPLFSDIPPKIDYDPVEAPSLIFVNFSPTSSPVIMRRPSCVYGAEVS